MKVKIFNRELGYSSQWNEEYEKEINDYLKKEKSKKRVCVDRTVQIFEDKVLGGRIVTAIWTK